MKKFKIGVIADDFTGAGDAASFLSKSGLSTILYSNIPKSLDNECDAVVIALKSRNVEPSIALSMVKKALSVLNKVGCEKLYFKYCSTFDSTKFGNIGVVLDYLLESTNSKYSLICPSLPVNGRIVDKGILYVDGEKLSDSPMKDHPLNPMWDSYIPILMKDQSKYSCFVLTKEDLRSNNLSDKIHTLEMANDKFYIVPDYVTDEDARLISKKFKELYVWSGGSGLLEFLVDTREKQDIQSSSKREKNKTIILCGSCSEATRRQIEEFRNRNGLTYSVDSKKLLNGTLDFRDIYEFVRKQSVPVLVYSAAVEGELTDKKKSETFEYESQLIEETMAKLAEKALGDDYNQIIVAGGETSGAVTLTLGYDKFYIGESVAPGVPILYPLENSELELVLKSGNFGSEDFFLNF